MARPAHSPIWLREDKRVRPSPGPSRESPAGECRAAGVLWQSSHQTERRTEDSSRYSAAPATGPSGCCRGTEKTSYKCSMNDYPEPDMLGSFLDPPSVLNLSAQPWILQTLVKQRVFSGTDLFALIKASPPVVHSSPVSILKVDVLPAPFTPSSPKHSPGRTPRHSRSTARIRPILRDLYTCDVARD